MAAWFLLHCIIMALYSIIQEVIVLYNIHAAIRQMMAPSTYAAHVCAQAFSDTDGPFAWWPGASMMAAGCELMYRINKDYGKPEFGIATIERNGCDVAVFEEIKASTPFCRLLHFRRMSDNPKVVRDMVSDPVILIVAPLSGHHSTLLRDTVSSMLIDHDVYITDWVDAKTIPLAAGDFGLDDYVHTVDRFMDLLPEGLHVMAVCQPVVPVLAAVSRRSARKSPVPRSMILIGGPVDARQSPTSVNNLATTHNLSWFENNVIHAVPFGLPGVGRQVYPGFLQYSGFLAMNPENHAKSHWEFFEDLVRGDDDDAEHHRKFYDEYNAVLDMPARYYLDTIRLVFQEYALAQGTWEIDGELVDPSLITDTAVLAIEGGRDDISGVGQTRAALDLCSSLDPKKKAHLLVEQVGHYGLFSGSRWRREIYPEVRDFISKMN